jgi:hypothetical protein
MAEDFKIGEAYVEVGGRGSVAPGLDDAARKAEEAKRKLAAVMSATGKGGAPMSAADRRALAATRAKTASRRKDASRRLTPPRLHSR